MTKSVDQPKLLGPTLGDQIDLIPILRKRLETANNRLGNIQDWIKDKKSTADKSKQ